MKKLSYIALMMVVLSNLALAVTPPIGDEASWANVKANGDKYLNKTFIMYGGAEVAAVFYRNWGFNGDADITYYCIDLTKLNDEGESLQDAISVYAVKTKFGPLIDEIAKAQDHGKMRAVRFKLTVTPKCLENGEFHNQVELVDWQAAENGKWGKWHFDKAETRPAAGLPAPIPTDPVQMRAEIVRLRAEVARLTSELAAAKSDKAR